MPRLRHKHSPDPDRYRRGKAIQNVGGDQLARGVQCVAYDKCTNPLVPDAPIALCGKHLREVYEFAQDLIAANWDDACRRFVADQLPAFKPPIAVRRRPRPGWVYFARFGDRIKVGYTEDLDQRMRAIPHDEVLGVVPGTFDDEQAWHRLLAEFRVAGEWYHADQAVLDQIRAVVAKAG